MTEHPPPELEMTLNGEFVSPPNPPFLSKIMLWAIVIAVIAGAIAIAAFALWLLMLILPIVFGASVVAWGLYRFQIWRAQKSLGGQRDLWRP